MDTVATIGGFLAYWGTVLTIAYRGRLYATVRAVWTRARVTLRGRGYDDATGQ